MKHMHHALIIVVFFLLIGGCTSNSPPEPWPPLESAFPRTTIQITTPAAQQHPFRVWVANSAGLRARGLMFEDSLAPDQGMLLLYPQPKTVVIWMKNTKVPLDLLFIDAEGTIVQTIRHTTPFSLEHIPSSRAVIAVLEIPAGSCERLQLAPGARLKLPAVPAN